MKNTSCSLTQQRRLFLFVSPHFLLCWQSHVRRHLHRAVLLRRPEVAFLCDVFSDARCCVDTRLLIKCLLISNRRQFPWNIILLVLFVSIPQHANITSSQTCSLAHLWWYVFPPSSRPWAWPSWWASCPGMSVSHMLCSILVKQRLWPRSPSPASTTPNQWSCVWESQLWCVFLSPSSASRAGWDRSFKPNKQLQPFC